MAKPKEGDTRGWVSARKLKGTNKVEGGSGYRYEGGKWVQYRGGKKTGVFKGHGGITGNVDVVGGLKSQGGRLLRTIAGLPDDEQIKSARKSGEKYRANNKNNKNQSKTSEKEKNRNNPLRIIKDTIRNVNYEKNRRNKLESKDSSNNKTTTSNKNRNKLTFSQGAKAIESAKKGSTTKTKSKPKDDGGKAAWLKKTRNSPAAKSGAFTDDERWALQQKHRKSKADKAAKSEAKKHANKGSGSKGSFGKGTHGKGLPSNPQLKTQTTKDKDRDPNRHSLKVEDKKKKENVPPGTRLSKMFDN